MRKESKVALARKSMPAFHPTAFFAKVGSGKIISKYRNSQAIFSQGDVGDAVYYVQMGRIKLTVVSERGKEESSASSGLVTFLAKGV